MILATKSANSYAELDRLVAAGGLDPLAEARPSLYGTLHSGNASDIAGRALRIIDVTHEEHRFRFDESEHLARYLATYPKYQFADSGGDLHALLVDRLEGASSGWPVTATSTVTLVLAAPP